MKLQAVDEIRRRVAEIELEAHGMFLRVEDGIGVNGLEERCG